MPRPPSAASCRISLLEINAGGEKQKSGFLLKEFPRIVEEVANYPADSRARIDDGAADRQEKRAIMQIFSKNSQVLLT